MQFSVNVDPLFTHLLGILAYSIHPGHTAYDQPTIFVQDFGAYPNELNESIINPSSVRKPEATSGAKLIEKEQFLILGTLFDSDTRVDVSGRRTFPIFRWSRLAASARKALYSVSCFLSGNEIP
jgi:hypothetical protein